MTDRVRDGDLARSSSHIAAAGTDSPGGSVRPRNRRLISTDGDGPSNQTSGLLSALSPATSRSVSPLPRTRSLGVSPSRPNNLSTGDLGQFFSDSWNQSWSSVQDLTSSLFNSSNGPSSLGKGLLNGGGGLKAFPRGRRISNTSGERKANASWGPAPPTSGPNLDDVASGSLAQRHAALKAARTASVLESHTGVNGGLDVSGKHKRRNSDEAVTDKPGPDDYLVYVHWVQASDTFAGIVLKYRCREDVFRRANGLWSRDSIQTRKWVTIPVDACDVRGRPCEAPSWRNVQGVDLLAPTPAIEDASASKATHDDYFSKANGFGADEAQAEEEEKPWQHVRWVKVDSIPQPVEIGRVARGAMGYFPPRRKKSIRTISSLSTPRQSFEIASGPSGSAEGPSSRRPSSLSSRPAFPGSPPSNRSRMGSDPADERPAWMKRPGGVGSMGRNVRAPGPDKDVINSWTKKHIPGLNIDGPSMSIMGSETAKFGFGKDAGIAESSYEEGRDAIAPTRQGTGIDRAAAAVETWLRGALAKGPGTPLGKARAGRSDHPNDLIELTDTMSDDGRGGFFDNSLNVDGLSLGSSARNDAAGGIRGRTVGEAQKGSKAD
ncbi:uncharacterized protein J7T54_004950 [Emericellopsis cladophorae]|uniref:LysM domain-containing protein n=1 Tax=Emericellopsis cladophorae TaxID=2686198 RepID=A0A9P9Y2K2_9HYPO|nr:uncharacterized protein J7T54_004950 [Emericellopsis cladophorae]KAI6781784.1 hypothetical protein J7T54_004950 [Emericellopsis cladophorae]